MKSLGVRLSDVRRRLSKGETRVRIVESTVWTLCERAVALLLSWGVSVVVANYLGVDAFGQLLFAVALVTLFTTLVTAGLSGVVVRDLVRFVGERHEILGTVFVIRLAAAAISVIALLATTLLIPNTEASTRILVAIVALGLFFNATDVIAFWFQSETRLRYVSLANIGGTVVGAITRLSLVLAGGSLVHFAWAVVVEQGVIALLRVVMYRKAVGPIAVWTYRPARAWAYLRQSWPLMLSGVAGTINLRVDQVMLGALLNSAAVGTYGIAARLSEIWYFVPTAIGNAVFPAIIRAEEQSETLYRRRLQQLYGAFAWGAVAVAVLVTLAGPPLIRLLYDEEFAGASAVLVVHVWSAPFLFMGVILSKWLIIEELLLTSLVRHGFGASLNVALNFVLIPAHGPVGSAVATLVSYAAATYGACFLSRRTWPAAIDMTLGLTWPIRIAFSTARRYLRNS